MLVGFVVCRSASQGPLSVTIIDIIFLNFHAFIDGNILLILHLYVRS